MQTSTPKFLLLFVWVMLLFTGSAVAQTKTKAPEDKSKRPSPPATVTGPNFTIEYSRPSMKGR